MINANATQQPFWRRPPLRTFAALALGILLGTSLAGSAAGTLIFAIAKPVGRLWLNALTMTVVPLVFGLLTTGIAGAAENASAGGVTRRALLWFAALLLAACTIAALLSTALLSLWPPALSASLAALPLNQSPPPDASTANWLEGLLPTNPIKAAADTAMVPLVAFALLFGFAMARIPVPSRLALSSLLSGLVGTMLVIVGWVLWLAPIGVFALALGVGAQFGLGTAGTVLHYIVVVASCCIAAGLFSAIIAMFGGRISPADFVGAVFPAQVVAVSTQSSLASLPAMIEAAPALGVERDSAGVILPLAVSIFRAASAAANVAVAIYLAHLHGVHLGAPTLAFGVLTAAAVSLAAVGLPAQVSFFATIAPVCVAIGAPITLLPLLLAVESVPDIFRTLGNVTADMAVARLAGSRSAPVNSQ